MQTTQKRTDYENYITSKEWFDKRNLVFKLLGRKCQRCEVTRRLHVHHKTYARFKNENIETDLTVLCHPCHDLYHKIYKHTGISTTDEFILQKGEIVIPKKKIRKTVSPTERERRKLEKRERRKKNKLYKFKPKVKLNFKPEKAKPTKIRGVKTYLSTQQLHNPLKVQKIEFLEL